MKHLDLFSGIGGFALATEMVWDNVEHIFCDNEPFAQAVLQKHWPNAKIYGDIREFKGDGFEPYLLTGGFPCQPFSQAGRRKGTADDRYLWPEMLRAVQLAKPTWVIAENVGGLVTWNDGMVLERVCTDLEAEGYEVQPLIIPACALGASHRRDRVWIIGHAKHDGLNGAEDGESDTTRGNGNAKRAHEFRQPEGTNSVREVAANTRRKRRSERSDENIRPESKVAEWQDDSVGSWKWDWTEVAANFCRVDDGVSKKLDRTPRLKALGNAIVPQVAAEIMRAIREVDSVTHITR